MRKLLALLFLALVITQPAYGITLTTSSLCLPKPTPGDPASQNTWGALLNTGADIIDAATQGVASISVAGSSNVVLTFNCGSLDQTDKAQFIFTGVLTGNINVIWPASRGRTFSVTNSTSGAFTLKLGANNGSGSPAGTTATIPQGYTGIYYSDGTNVYGRVTSGGITMAANSIIGNIQSSTGPAADVPIPTCAAGQALSFTSGSGLVCVTATGGGGGGGGSPSLAYGGVMTTNFTAVANTIYCIDTTLGTVSMTLPATPVNGNEVVWMDCNGSFATNAFTVLRNGNNIMSLNQDMTVGTQNAGSTMLFSGVTYGWRMF